MPNAYQNNIQDNRITSLEDKFGKMCDNHSHDIGVIQVDIAEIKTNQKYLVWFMVAQVGALLGLFFK